MSKALQRTEVFYGGNFSFRAYDANSNLVSTRDPMSFPTDFGQGVSKLLVG
ncbi:hypothetical protein [Rubritalea tangerina]|uniref:hypothetical protein n=1 Tax=Rubritalea tangerina TaxID=430798 RepID=UPI0036122E52